MNEQTRVVCGHCSATNRVPTNRLGESPICGRCRSALFEGHPLELGQEAFRVHQRNSDLPLLVDFWAAWCGPCRVMAPTFAAAAARLEPGLRLIKVNTEENQQLATALGIRSIPTLLLFRDGREIARQSGNLPLPELLQFAQQAGDVSYS